jgi:hypothetical protein
VDCAEGQKNKTREGERFNSNWVATIMNSRSPSGMTTRKARTTTNAREQQIPFGDDNKKSKDNNKCS